MFPHILPIEYHQKFLRGTTISIAPALTLIYKAPLHQGELPLVWKRAYVTPDQCTRKGCMPILPKYKIDNTVINKVTFSK